MWPKGTIIVCVDDTPRAEYTEVGMDNGIKKGQMYTVRSYATDVKFSEHGMPVVAPGVWLNEVKREFLRHLPSWSTKDPNDMPYAAERFRKLESTYDESMIAQSIKIHRDIRDLHKLLEV